MKRWIQVFLVVCCTTKQVCDISVPGRSSQDERYRSCEIVSQHVVLPLVPICRGEAGLPVTVVICFHWSLLLAFSLHFSSSSAFLRSLFIQSSHLSCDLPRFLQPSCLFFSDLFSNLSSFILTMYQAHFTRLLTILPIIQALGQTSSPMSPSVSACISI